MIFALLFRRFLTKLVKVDLSHNQIVQVTDRAFGRNADLKQLNLEGNKISTVTNKTFFGLTNAEVINLRGNEIEALPENLFKFAPSLSKLDLGGNRIAKIDPKALGDLGSSLKILHLEDNFLEAVPAEAIYGLTSLAELHLAGNPLTVIPANSFVQFRGLLSLDLSGCSLGEVHNLAFNGLGTLRHLKLANNNLGHVPTEALRRIPNLHFLSIGRNPLTSVKENGLSPLRRLRHLEMSGCKRLTTIEARAFEGMQELKHVTISLNKKLTTISGEAFDAASLTTLRRLDLSDNGLSRVEPRLVSWQHLTSLDLSGNPWECNCNLAFVPEVLNHLATNHSDKIVAGICSSPANLQGVSLQNLKLEDCKAANKVSAAASPNSRSSGAEAEVELFNDLKDQKEAIMQRHEATNSLAVIVSVSIVSTVVAVTLLALIYLKCRGRMSNLVKEWKWRRHDQALARKTGQPQSGLPGGPGLPSHLQSYSGDNYIYTSPRLHHTYVYHGASPLNQAQYALYMQQAQAAATESSQDTNTDEEEYFYVSTSQMDPEHGQQLVQNCGPHLGQNGQSLVTLTNGSGQPYTSTLGKHIPVTVL